MDKIQELSIALYLLLMMCDAGLGISEFGKKCDDNAKEKRLYGKTSDRELYGPSLEISSIGTNRHRDALDYGKSNFYDPSYGFSKESLADIGITERNPESLAEESIMQPDIVPGKSYHRHVYTKYPDLLGNGYKSLLQQSSYQPSFSDDSKFAPGYINPLTYLRGFVDKSKLEESSRLIAPDLDVFNKPSISTNDYEQFIKDAYKKSYDFSALSPDYGKLLRNPKDENGYDSRFLWQGSAEGRPLNQFSNFGKGTESEDNKYFSELLEQSKAVTDYINKFSNQAEYEVNETDEFNTLKFREGDRPRRQRRPPPGPRNKSPRHLPSGRVKVCIGSRCGNKIRRPRYTLY